MQISKKGAVAALKEAWKRGYEIVPSGSRISVYTENWALEAETARLPLEVSQALVEHYGGIPTAAMFVQKGKEGQTMIDGDLEGRREELLTVQQKPNFMHRAPVTFRDRWAMFVASDGRWLCVDLCYLDILEELGWCDIMMSDNGMAIFSLNGDRLTVAPGKFSHQDCEKLRKIAEMYVEQRVQIEEMPENLCLFGDMERE